MGKLIIKRFHDANVTTPVVVPTDADKAIKIVSFRISNPQANPAHVQLFDVLSGAVLGTSVAMGFYLAATGLYTEVLPENRNQDMQLFPSFKTGFMIGAATALAGDTAVASPFEVNIEYV